MGPCVFEQRRAQSLLQVAKTYSGHKTNKHYVYTLFTKEKKRKKHKDHMNIT